MMETNMVGFLTKKPLQQSHHSCLAQVDQLFKVGVHPTALRSAVSFQIWFNNLGKTHAGDGSERGRGVGQTKNKNKCYSFGLSVLTDGQGVIYYPA